MSCECYVGAVKVEYAVSPLVTAVACAYQTDNAGYYDISGTYVPSGSGHNDRVFAKRKTTHYGTKGSYWVQLAASTNISINSGASCPTEDSTTNYVSGFDYGSSTGPSRDEFSNPVLGSDLRTYAETNAAYGSWLPRLSQAVVNAQPASDAVDSQLTNTTFDYGNTEYSINAGPDTVSYASVKKIKFRFSLAGPQLPVKIKYDLYNVTNNTTVSTNNVINLNAGNPSEEVELPLTSNKAIRIQNVRFWFCPFHV